MNCCVKKYDVEPWIEGARAVITGGNSGIGKETAKKLIQLGVNVIIACRNMEKAEEVVSELKKEINEKNGSICAMKIDLNSFKSVREFVKSYESKYDSLEILINNAGSTTSGTMTEDGFETAFQSNYMSHFLLTYLLLPTIKKSKNGRIINFSSVIHRLGSGNFKESANGTYSASYRESKYAMTLFTFELQRRLRLEGNSHVKVVAVHPGVSSSNIWRNRPALMQKILPYIILTPEQGCASSVYAATSDEIEGGEYVSVYCYPFSPKWYYLQLLMDGFGIYSGHSILTPSEKCTNQAEEELWNWTIETLKL